MIYTPAHLRALAELAKEENDAAQRAIRLRASAAIRNGTLTPDLAISLWHEAHASSQLLRGLEKRANIASSESEAELPLMKGA